jgi:tRNA (cytidine/uridine-2'-O-)-methyltransferase
MLNLVLYQPDIPQNLGACLRLSACLGCTIHVIEPCGFPMDDTKLRRAGMDYMHKAKYLRHVHWQAFLDYRIEQDGGTRVAEGEPQRGRGLGARPPSVGVNYEGEPLAAGVEGARPPSRLLLLETDGTTRYTDMVFTPTDYVVLGSEGAGTPRALYALMDATLTIPMRDGMRSLNLAMSAGMLVAEACRQSSWLL